MTNPEIPVFLNGSRLAARAGSTLRTLLVDHAPDLVDAVASGAASAVDARGLPVDADAPLAAGAILRVSRSARQADGDPDA